MSKAKKAILITFIVLLVLAVLILGIIFGSLIRSRHPEQADISIDKLSTVMEDDIVYLSDEFLTINNLKREVRLGRREDYVMLGYDRNKVVNCPNFSARVENIDECSYYLSSKEDSDGIPVTIGVCFSTRKDKDKNHKYKQEYNGYKYCTDIVLDNKLIYYIKTTPRNGATCIVSLKIEVKKDVASKYTEEQKNARIEQIFKSAVDNIVYYNEL